MTPGRAFTYGMTCIIAGWLTGGLIEYFHAPIWAAVLVLVALFLAVAATADWILR